MSLYEARTAADRDGDAVLSESPDCGSPGATLIRPARSGASTVECRLGDGACEVTDPLCPEECSALEHSDGVQMQSAAPAAACTVYPQSKVQHTSITPKVSRTMT